MSLLAKIGVLKLPHRSILELCGPDSLNLLQGLVTNDLRLLQDSKPISALMLNTQGRIIEDLIISKKKDKLLVECSSSGRSDFKKLLEKYRLRKKVDISKSTDSVGFTIDQSTDPRFSELGGRIFGADGREDSSALNEYHQRRREYGIAEGREELAGMLPFQANADLLNMISYDKGCYIGQELTARTAHTGVVRRRILPFHCDQSVSGQVFDENDKKVGVVVSSGDDVGLAVIALNSFSKSLFVDKVKIRPYRPKWIPDQILTSST